MVEPFAAVVISSLLPARASLKSSGSLTSVARSVRKLARQPVASDFFTPAPRRAKGKERAVDPVYCTSFGHVLQCKEWSCFVSRHSIWYTDYNRRVILQELPPRRAGIQRSPHSSRNRHRRSSLHAMTSSIHPGQRRNASTSSDPSERGQSSSKLYPDNSQSSSSAQLEDESDGFALTEEHYIPQFILVGSPRNAKECTAMVGVGLPYNNASTSATEEASTYALDALDSVTVVDEEASQHAAVEAFYQVLDANPKRMDLESAWETYDIVMKCDAVHLVRVSELFLFSDRMAEHAIKLCQTGERTALVAKWGTRMQAVLDVVSSRAQTTFEDFRRCCLLAGALGYKGKIEEATATIRLAEQMPRSLTTQPMIISVYNTILASISHHYNNASAVEYIVDEWTTLGSLALRKRLPLADRNLPVYRLFRKTVRQIVSNIHDPARLLDEKRAWSNDRLELMGHFLIESLCDMTLATVALSVLQQMKKKGLITPLDIQLMVVRGLAKKHSFEFANELFSTLTPTPYKGYLSTALFLYSRQGDTTLSEKYYNDLVEHGRVSEPDLHSLIYAYAYIGRADHVLTLFNEFFPEGQDGKRMNHPQIHHYTTVIYGYAQAGDFEGMNQWLRNMSQARYQPDVVVYTVILQSFAKRGDLDSMEAILSQMKEVGIAPNRMTYTTLISLLAKRKDPVHAEALYKRAMDEGVIPDTIMVSALLDAHVEAGSWKGAIRAFDYINNSTTHFLKLNIDIYNTLLKAYVLIGAPFRVISRLFEKLERTGLRPDGYTYGLLIMAACDARLMQVASDIFWEMDALKEKRKWSNLVNAFSMTILMAGYLRVKDRTRAKAVYDEMVARGIQPTPVTFQTMLKSYGNEKTEESLRIAEGFVKSLMSTPQKERVWDKPLRAQNSVLDYIYGPLIDAYGKQGKVEDVERVFQEMMDAGGEPNLGVFTMLLDAYRRAGNIDATLQIWPQVFDLGLQLSKVDSLFVGREDDPSRRRLQSNILCIPLSIYVDALSAAGMHVEIAEVWKKFQMHRLAFDSHNWNHMAVALVRAGEVERAFEVLEKVILPYQRATLRAPTTRDPKPKSPLVFQSLYSSDEVPGEPPLHKSARRPKTVRAATKLLVGDPALVGENEEQANDFIHPLQILHEVTPSFNVWRPHGTTLSVLLRVLLRLQSGSTIKPVGVNPEEEERYEDLDAKEEKMKIAMEMLNQIYRNYPNAVREVLAFEQQEMRKMGVRYNKTYNWT